MHFSSRVGALAGALLLTAGSVQADYQLETSYDNTNFFQGFDFFTEQDPTQGFVDYVDANTANAEGLAGYAKGGIFMGVDHQTKNPANGRKSVRVTSHKAFTRGLFVADIAHMPGSICGSWPAYWMFGPDWPGSGEIDIIEGVNAQTKNSMTLHTGQGCQMSNAGALSSTKLKSIDCGASGASSGCGQDTGDNQNYGDGFNAIGGGVYATEWTSDHIAIWFFPRHSIPSDINSEAPDPSGWGKPAARFVGGQGCDIDSHFKNNQIVFDTTFCGVWAGAPDVWNNDAECSALAPTCKDYVSGNPEAFAEAYWVLNSVKVYQQTNGSAQPKPKPQPGTSQPAQPTYQPQPTLPPSPPPAQTSQKAPETWWNQPGTTLQQRPAQPTQQVQQPPPPPPPPAAAPSWNGEVWGGLHA